MSKKSDFEQFHDDRLKESSAPTNMSNMGFGQQNIAKSGGPRMDLGGDGKEGHLHKRKRNPEVNL